MPILVIAFVVGIVACLLVYAVNETPMKAPLPVILKVAILLIAALVIADRAGLL